MPARILVVEDEPHIRSALVEFLTDEGFQVQYAAHGADALVLHAHTPADLILTDLMMPVLDGHRLIERLRQGGDPTPVILMTASGMRSFLPPGVRFMEKPFDLDRLLGLIERGLAGRSTR